LDGGAAALAAARGLHVLPVIANDGSLRIQAASFSRFARAPGTGLAPRSPEHSDEDEREEELHARDFSEIGPVFPVERAGSACTAGASALRSSAPAARCIGRRRRIFEERNHGTSHRQHRAGLRAGIDGR
jgi:hypothetical protein